MDTKDQSSPPAKRQKLDTSAGIPNGSHSDERSKLKAEAEKRREVRAGITAYVNASNNGFKGILKTRYTDFLVNEISPSGQVLHLQNLELPAKLHQERAQSGTEKSANSGQQVNGKDTSDTAQHVADEPSNGDQDDAGSWEVSKCTNGILT